MKVSGVEHKHELQRILLTLAFGSPGMKELILIVVHIQPVLVVSIFWPEAAILRNPMTFGVIGSRIQYYKSNASCR